MSTLDQRKLITQEQKDILSVTKILVQLLVEMPSNLRELLCWKVWIHKLQRK